MEKKSVASQDKFFTIQPAKSQEDYDFVTKMATEEQWGCVGSHIVPQLGPVCKPGFFIAFLNEKRIGCVGAFKYGEEDDGFCHIGLYIVEKPFRGNGYGLKLWNTMWESFGKNWNISLDAVIDMIPRYEKMGLRQAWLNKEYVVSCSKVVQALQKSEPMSRKIKIESINQADFDKVCTYDASIFGFSRPEFLKKWITTPKSIGFVATNESREVIGYAVLQASLSGNDQLVSPFFSDDNNVTKFLLSTVAKVAVEQQGADNLRLGVPVGANPTAAELVEKEIGYNAIYKYMRMYSKGVPPQVCMEKVVSITSIAIG